MLYSVYCSVILLEVRVGWRIFRFLFHEYSLDFNTGRTSSEVLMIHSSPPKTLSFPGTFSSFRLYWVSQWSDSGVFVVWMFPCEEMEEDDMMMRHKILTPYFGQFAGTKADCQQVLLLSWLIINSLQTVAIFSLRQGPVWLLWGSNTAWGPGSGHPTSHLSYVWCGECRCQ